MISVEEASALISSQVRPLYSRSVLLSQLAKHHTLLDRFYADRPYPPFDRVMMDGIAVDLRYERSTWKIQCVQRAGDQRVKLHEDQAIEIMTGAVLPEHANAVIRYEDLRIEGDVAQLLEPIRKTPFMNVHRMGSDCWAGDCVVREDSSLTAAQIGVLASIGQTELRAVSSPKIAIVGTGDELVDPSGVPSAVQIRASNIYALRFACQSLGCPDTSIFLCKDSPEDMFSLFQEALQNHDLLIISGSVSKGKFDFAPAVLSDLGVKNVFHRVRQKPGKPLWFGLSENEKPVFGLPGNPQSSLVCFYRYVALAIDKLMARTQKKNFYSRLANKLPRRVPDLTHFIPVRVSIDEQAVFSAEVIDNQGSGDFINFAKADGFIEIPAGDEEVPGTVYKVYIWGGYL